MIARTLQTWNLFREKNVESKKRPRAVGQREHAEVEKSDLQRSVQKFLLLIKGQVFPNISSVDQGSKFIFQYLDRIPHASPLPPNVTYLPCFKREVLDCPTQLKSYV